MPFLKPQEDSDFRNHSGKIKPGFLVQGVLGNWKILCTTVENTVGALHI